MLPLGKQAVALYFLVSNSCVCALSISFFYRNHATVALTAVEANNTVNKGEESVILTHAYVLTRIVYSTALTNDDVTSNAGLTAPNLNA